MRATSAPWQLLSVIFAGVLNEHQRRVIEYLKAENQVLRERIGDKRARRVQKLGRHDIWRQISTLSGCEQPPHPGNSSA